MSAMCGCLLDEYSPPDRGLRQYREAPASTTEPMVRRRSHPCTGAPRQPPVARVDRRRRWRRGRRRASRRRRPASEHREHGRQGRGSGRTRRGPDRARRPAIADASPRVTARRAVARAARGRQVRDQAQLGPRRPTARRSRRWRRPGPGSRATSTTAARRSPRGAPPRPRRAHRARRSSIIAASAGGRSCRRLGLGRSASGRRRGGGAAQARARAPRAARPSRAGSRPARATRRQVGRQRLVEHPEQAALEVHRQPSILAQRVEFDRDAGPTAALARRAAERRHEAEVVEDHRPDVEDERLGRLERLLDHRDQLPDLAARPWLGSRRHQALDDLGLEDDVGQALGGAVVHRPGDLAAQVLLRVEHQPRDGRRHRARPRSETAGADARRRRPPSSAHVAASASSDSAYAASGVAIAPERPSLALEDVDLRSPSAPRAW